MSSNLSRQSPSAKQSEVEGWMVLIASPPHNSNESNSSEEELTVTKKRKFRKSSLSPRSAKSPRISASDISAKPTRPFASGSQTRYSLGATSANQSTFTRTGASGNGNGDASVSDGNGRGSIGSSGMTRVNDRLSGASVVPTPVQGSSISASDTNANGIHLRMDKQTVPGTTSISRTILTSGSSAAALEIGSSGSASTRKAMGTASGDRSSSDSLPDPSEIVRALSSPTIRPQEKDNNAKGKGKEITRRLSNNAFSVASNTGLHKKINISSSNPEASANKPLILDGGVIIISSDSEVELQLNAKKSRPRQLQSSRKGLDKSEEAKGYRKRAFLSDSEGANDVKNGPDMIEQGRKGQSSPSGPTSSTSITRHAHALAHSLTRRSHDASQMRKGDKHGSPDLGAKRTKARPTYNSPSLANDGRSSDHRLSSEISKTITGSSSVSTKTSAQAEPSLADVISMSLGGGPSSSSTVDHSFWIRPTRRKSIFSPPPSNHLHSSQKVAPPPVDAEIIDLCSDSDDPMDADDFLSSDLGPSSTVHDAAVSGTVSQPGATQDEASVRLSYDTSPPCVVSSPTVPASSNPPDSSPRPHVLTSPFSYPETLDPTTDLVGVLTDLSGELENYPEVTSPLRSDAAEETLGVSSVHRVLSRSNSSNPSVNGFTSGSSNKGPFRRRSSSASVGSLYTSRLRNSVAGSPAQDLVAPVSEMHLHTDMDDILQDTLDSWPIIEEHTSIETISEDVPVISDDTQGSASERISPAASSGMAISSGTRSEASAPSVQRARKTTRVVNRRVNLDKEKATRGAGASQAMNVEKQYDATVTTPAGKRALAVKEPDFAKLRADIPDVFSTDGRLSAAIKWPAEKVPIELHDMINCLPLNYHYNPQMKYVFEAMMEENTADDEPTSPRIEIYGGKTGPVTPPWEFYYSNKIFHGKGVPRSNKKKLKGCNCIGPCNPKSKTCTCVQRQMTWTGDDKSIKGFLYNKKGKLVDLSYPVFECNAACECSDDCTNRVIQHGRRHAISIMHTKNKGWGVFADEKISRGTYLGIYAGEMVLESEADERGKLYDHFGRTYLFDVDFWHLRKLDEDAQKRSGDDPLSQASTSGGIEERFSSTYTIDAFHVGNFTRFLNHSCDPNCQITASYVNEPDLRKPMLTIYTCRDVRQGEELTFAYFGPKDDEESEEEEAEVDEHGQKKVYVVGGPSSHKNQAVHRPCLCGAANCRGEMF